MAKDVHAPGTAADSSKSKPVLSLLVATIGSDPNEQEHPLLHVHQVADACLPLQDHDVEVNVKVCALSEKCTESLVQLLIKKPNCRHSAASSFAGVVTRIGALVTRCSVGDNVAGVLPLDSDSSACCQQCIASEFNMVQLPDTVTCDAAACCAEDGIAAYLALHYLGHVVPGDTVLVMDAATAFGCLVIQLAHHYNAKVLAVISSNQDRNSLEKLQPMPEHVIEMDSKMSATTLYSSVMEETGHLGVDVFIDNGVKEPKQSNALPSPHDVISCLAVGGRWVTKCTQLQLDPPNSRQLFLRGASVGFLFPPSWTLSSAHQGKWLHILTDVVDKLAKDALKPHISQVVSLADNIDAFENLGSTQLGKILVEIGNS